MLLAIKKRITWWLQSLEVSKGSVASLRAMFLTIRTVPRRSLESMLLVPMVWIECLATSRWHRSSIINIRKSTWMTSRRRNQMNESSQNRTTSRPLVSHQAQQLKVGKTRIPMSGILQHLQKIRKRKRAIGQLKDDDNQTEADQHHQLTEQLLVTQLSVQDMTTLMINESMTSLG